MWACNCGFRNNYAMNKTCWGCHAAKGFGKRLPPQPASPSQRTPAATNARAARAAAAASAPTPEAAREPKALSEADEVLKDAKSVVEHWKRMLRVMPGNVTAATGLADAEEALRVAKMTVESGRSHTDRLQSAVTRQAQAVKEHARVDAEHTDLSERLEAAAIRLSAAAALRQEADQALLSLQIEGAGPQTTTPIPAHLQAGTFFTVWSEAARQCGCCIPDAGAFHAIAAELLRQMGNRGFGAYAAAPAAPGFGFPGPVGVTAAAAFAAMRVPGPAAPAPPIPAHAAPQVAAAAVPAGSVPPGPQGGAPLGHAHRPAGRSRSLGGTVRAGDSRPLTGLDAHFKTTGIRTPLCGDWAGQPPAAHTKDPAAMDPSGWSTPRSHHSERSRSRSPVGPVGSSAAEAEEVASTGSLSGGPAA